MGARTIFRSWTRWSTAGSAWPSCSEEGTQQTSCVMWACLSSTEACASVHICIVDEEHLERLQRPAYTCGQVAVETPMFLAAGHSERQQQLSIQSRRHAGSMKDVSEILFRPAGVRYNCRIFLLDGRVLFIRPKLAMADDGNYR